MARIEAAQLTTPEYIAEIADGLGRLVAQRYYPVRFDYAFSSCVYPTIITLPAQPHAGDASQTNTEPTLELPGTPVLNLVMKKISRNLYVNGTRPLLVRQVSLYGREDGGITAMEADLPKWSEEPETVDMSYPMRQELYRRDAAGDLVTGISTITTPTVRMIDRLIARCVATDGIELTPVQLSTRNHAFYDE